jgi:pimeloyl-ACP methyl ester carboxylesterase
MTIYNGQAMTLDLTYPLHAKRWGNPQGIPILALHGWLDNAASFDHLAPLFPELQWVVLDLPGHGHSAHKPPGQTLHIIDVVIEIAQVIEALGWTQCLLIGHSLGAAISSLLAGLIPERFLGVMLLDGLGPITAPAEQGPAQARLYLEESLKLPYKTLPRYSTLAAAVHARQRVSDMLPSSTQLLVERGIIQTQTGDYQWRTDPRLLLPVASPLTEPQVHAFLNQIRAPLCLLQPQSGYPFPPAELQARRAAIPQLQYYSLPGRHHVHLDAPNPVANILQDFLMNHTTLADKKLVNKK